MTPAETATAPLKYAEGLFHYKRRKTRVVMVGRIGVGGNNPIRVQSMTTTDTLNVEATILQSQKMVESGCEIVRITAPTPGDARALGKIKEGLLKRGIDVPLVADIHFSPQAAMEAAEYVEKVRINPGNFVDTKRFAVKEYTDEEYAKELERIEERFTPLVEKLKRLKRALRIGTNHGSLSDRILNRYGDTPLGMVESSLEFVRICEKNGFQDIILSMKSSNPKVMIAAYRLLAARMGELGMDYPFHLGVTEAGGGEDGRIKSAIGIGSLLADGIGDTIRVSLTEDPELEVPVCFALAKPYQNKPAASEPKDYARLSHATDSYSYSRRKSALLRVGPFLIGKDQPVRVATPIPAGFNADQILPWMEKQLKSGGGAEPEILSSHIKSQKDIDAIAASRKALALETSRLAFLGRFEGPLDLALAGLSHFNIAAWAGEKELFPSFLQKAKELSIPVLIEAATAKEVIEMEALAKEKGVPVLLGLTGNNTSDLIYEYSLLAAQSNIGPIHIHAPHFQDTESRLLEASVLIGSLLCDGTGDSVELETQFGPEKDLRLSYDILQGAGSRVTKTEFVSCPSCGRTLFDLQSTTERIKSKTWHLKGVKIAIMGCIVNGPGEMADADFGYVGGAPAKINLYVGKECVKKGVPAEEADEALVALIKSHGKWVEP